MINNIRLGVNIDHVATLRNARGGDHPQISKAAIIAENAGAIVTSLDNKSFKYGKEDYKNPTILIRRSKNLNV